MMGSPRRLAAAAALAVTLAACATSERDGTDGEGGTIDGSYLDSVTANGVHDLHLLGWTGDYNDPGNFVGTFFGTAKPDFGITDPAVFSAIGAAEGTVDPAARAAASEQVDRDLMTRFLPAVPISHSPTALVTRENIGGLVPSR